MGNVRSKLVKRTAKMLVEQYPDAFTVDFELNKKKLMEIADIPSRQLRNQIAGYITRLVRRKKLIEQRLSMRQEITMTDEEEYIRRIEGFSTSSTA
ncbi:30S ribosomal protein S17e [Thermofilum pendens]|uniref:Small ribosomal subunit protein eS17 n=1 Tax=Thermofilum pendens (strain DSM 2475 / Hrk 5) TaxID=368408 RepID=A1RX28_THEPD|nr:30S ribosomal protein S17e [Thermofilum pendens]ABL77758.1 SSU ribosomal protein S17E [Thermofilum pendens Hrk 5]